MLDAPAHVVEVAVAQRVNAGSDDHSDQVYHHPWRIPAEVEKLICEQGRANPKWGAHALRITNP